MNLSASQRRLLKKLVAGWYLDGCGKEGAGGWVWTEGKPGSRVTVADMNYLYLNSLIEHECVIADYKISEAGRASLAGRK